MRRSGVTALLIVARADPDGEQDASGCFFYRPADCDGSFH